MNNILNATKTTMVILIGTLAFGVLLYAGFSLESWKTRKLAKTDPLQEQIDALSERVERLEAAND